ncbi:hypothetical protein MTR67_023423 [Solanum verrucosum]|uniref:Retrotransposon gag domain-containing protein n=1 Tax=Solanum verrucosum TaxID=315347 RepID=A0AAF0TYL9_SOLVR|nr:hypothetical protein MTR67_023423 [Solanum verrucosum]
MVDRGALHMSWTSSQAMGRQMEEVQNHPELKHQTTEPSTGVELASYKLKCIARIWYDKWKKNRAEAGPLLSWAVFESAFLERFFPRELREDKVREFMNLKQEALSVQEYNLLFIQLSHYAPKMVADMRSRIHLFVSGLSLLSSKEGKAAMLIVDMDISKLMIYVQWVEEDKLKDI